jgi:HemK-related putative methylase
MNLFDGLPMTPGQPASDRPQRFLAALARGWLTLRYRLLDRRYGRLVLEEIDGVPILVLPQVFNPVLLRSGVFMVRWLEKWPATLSRGASVLDLGSGTGVGAVFAARMGARVTAVDINPEAVRCTRINALLSGLEERIEVLPGDLFKPVRGRQFDLILLNPPYHRGKPGDELDHAWRGERVFERFAAGLGEALAPGGAALVVLSSDGDGDRLLALLRDGGFAVSAVGSKNMVNEIMTVWGVER